MLLAGKRIMQSKLFFRLKLGRTRASSVTKRPGSQPNGQAPLPPWCGTFWWGHSTSPRSSKATSTVQKYAYLFSHQTVLLYRLKETLVYIFGRVNVDVSEVSWKPRFALIAAFSSSVWLGLVSLIILSTIQHRFSVGLKWGQLTPVIPWSLHQLLVVLALWAGAKCLWLMEILISTRFSWAVCHNNLHLNKKRFWIFHCMCNGPRIYEGFTIWIILQKKMNF